MYLTLLRNWVYLFILLPLACFAQGAEEVLIPSADGTQIKVHVRHPTGLDISQPRPVVLALHGCGGLYATIGNNQGKLNARHAGMAQLIAENGYSIVFPDSFTTRGESSICSQKFNVRTIKQSHRSDDVDGVLQWLASQSWVDSSKIALLGWSHGGSTVLSSTHANRQKVATRKIQPSVAVAFYPGCSDALKDNYRPQVPLIMMLAELDDWTPPGPCIQLAQKTGAKLHLYPNSYHDFDNPIGTVRLRTDVPNGVNPGKGVHVGRNPITGPQAWAELLETLQKSWR
jgi:dienelactone hydrolase